MAYSCAGSKKYRRFRAWIFTAVFSRYRFVYPTFEETTRRAIEACEAAWEFFGGSFRVLIPDNTKAIIAADQQTVRFYHHNVLIKTHPRKPPGGRSIDAQDYPVERSVYALRDVQSMQRQAEFTGETG